MPNDRALTIHFNDGTSLSVAFPAQREPGFVSRGIEELLELGNLAIEADGTLLVIPLSSVKYVQAVPAPAELPRNVIKGASIIS